MKIAQIVLGRAKVIVFVALVLAVLGVRSYLIAPQAIFPAMSFARIDVVADAGDLTPERVRIAVTRPLEVAFGTLPYATRVRSTSSQGTSELLVDFASSTDPRVDLQYTQSAIASLQPTLPAIKHIDAVVVNPNGEPVVSYGLMSHVLSQTALNTFVTTRILPAFAGTPGLGRTSVVGGPPVEYRVELNSGALAAVGLSAKDVSTAIADAANVTSVGTTERFSQRYVILIDAGVHDAKTLARIAIPLKNGTTIALGSLGRVSLGVGVTTVEAAVNGEHGVVLNAFALPGADVVSLKRAFSARLDAVKAQFPADVRIVKYWDETRLIVDSQTSLRDAILLGALLAVAVIYAFLRSLRMTLVAAALIPLALAIAIFVLERSGQSLNLMSVGGLAVAVGLIIDDAIVVIEAIARGVADHPNQPHAQTVAEAIGKIGGAMAASTLTTVVVFLPLGLLTGVTGFFFRALAFTLATSLLVSLALALGVAPVIASALLRGAKPVRERPDRLHAFYEPIVRWALGHRPAVFAAAGVILTATVVLLSRLPSDFLPKLDEGEFEIKYTLPAGATLAVSDRAASRMEQIVMRDPAVVSVGRLTGIDTNGFTPTQANVGTIRIALTAGSRPSYDEISNRLRDALSAAVPAASLDFHQLLEDQINDLSGAPSPIEIAVSGAQQQTLIDTADAITDKISKVHGVVDAFDGVTFVDPSLQIDPQRAQLARAGVTAGDIGDALGARAQGAVATQIPGETATIPVDVRVSGATPDAGALPSATLFTASGPASLAALAAVTRPARSSEVNEENAQRVVRVTANIEGASLSAVVAGLRGAIAQAGVPAGYHAVIGGTYETQQASFREFLSVIALAVVLVFSVMLGTFGSFRLPLVILCAIPLALIGVALALFVTGTPVNVSSFMGLLLLVGIVVKNGILLIDVANKRRQAGDDVTTALVTAGSTRVRPIVMTTLAAIGGLFPLALGFGAGAAMEQPLAIAVIGGLSTATAFTLVLIPVLYATFLGGGDTERTRVARRGGTVVASTLALVIAVAHCASAQTLPAPSPLPQASPASASPLPAAASSAAPDALPASLMFASIDAAAAQDLALTNSPDVLAARATVDSARAALGVARGASGLAIVGGYSELPQGSPTGTIAQRTTSYGAQVTLGDLTAYAPLVAQASYGLRAAQSDELAAERTERVKTIGLYYAALKARAIARARTDAVASAQAQLDAARKRFAAGESPKLDVVRAQVALARAQADLASARAADGSATDALAREVGRPMSALSDTADTRLAPAAAVPEPDAAVTQALATRADVASAEANVRAATAAVSAAQRGFIPALTLGAGYNNGIDSGFPANGPTLQAQLAIPVGGVIASRVHEQRALLAIAQAKRAGAVRAVAIEVGNAARTAAASIEAERASQAAVSAAHEELAAAQLGYANGASTSLDVTLARSTYVAAQIDALSTHYDRLQAVAILQTEIGR